MLHSRDTNALGVNTHVIGVNSTESSARCGECDWVTASAPGDPTHANISSNEWLAHAVLCLGPGCSLKYSEEMVDTGVMSDALRSLQNLPSSPSPVCFTICPPMHFSLEKRVQIPLQIQTEKRNWRVLKEAFIRKPDDSSQWRWRIRDKFENSPSVVRTENYIRSISLAWKAQNKMEK